MRGCTCVRCVCMCLAACVAVCCCVYDVRALGGGCCCCCCLWPLQQGTVCCVPLIHWLTHHCMPAWSQFFCGALAACMCVCVCVCVPHAPPIHRHTHVRMFLSSTGIPRCGVWYHGCGMRVKAQSLTALAVSRALPAPPPPAPHTRNFGRPA